MEAATLSLACMTYRYCCIIIGRWMWRDWHLYRDKEHVSARNAAIRWRMWDRVL